MDKLVLADLAASELAMQNSLLAQKEFQIACNHNQWERAEAARLTAIAEMENSMDALMRACRRVEMISNGQ